MSRGRCARRRGCGLGVVVSNVYLDFLILIPDIPSRAARHDVLVEKCMNWRTVAGRGRPIGRRKDMKGVTAAMFVGYRMRHVIWCLYGEVKGLDSLVISKVPLHCPLDRRSASCSALPLPLQLHLRLLAAAWQNLAAHSPAKTSTTHTYTAG